MNTAHSPPTTLSFVLLYPRRVDFLFLCSRAPCPLELPAPLLRPALHYNLGLREKLHRMVRLRVQIAEEALAPSAERKRRHRSGHAHVDADVTRIHLVAEAPRIGAVSGKNARHVSVAASIHERNSLFNRLRVDQAQDRPKNLRPRRF